MSEPLKAVEAEADAAPEGVLVPLTTDEGTVEILIPPPSMWFEGAVEHLTAGRISEWVKLAVEDRESLDLWNSRRKRYRDLDAFLTAWSEAAGETPGKSQASAPSSRSTQKR